MDASTKSFFGQNVDTSLFSPSTRNSAGFLRCCSGISNSESRKPETWYGIFDKDTGEKIEPKIISICDYCKHKSFDDSEVFEVKDEEYPGLIPYLACDIPVTERVKEHIGDRRSVFIGGIKINVNITDMEDEEWAPVTKLLTPEAKKAEAVGVLLADVPTMSYWEFVIKGDEDSHLYTEENYFKVEAKDGTGRVIKIADQNGNTNFVTPIVEGMTRVNSYDTAPDNRFFFQAPSSLEVENKLEASHNKQSNKIFITVSIFRKETIEPVVGSPNEPRYRGGGGLTRGGGSGLTRGGGGGAYTGGSNFAASGKSNVFNTRKVNARFIKIKEVEGIVQLVNNESEEERIFMTKKIQDTITEKGEDESEIASRRAEMLSVLID